MEEKYKLFLDTHKEFDWFIIEYFSEETLLRLIELAKNKHNTLFSMMNDIWFCLPDSKFNIIENPKGWNEFLAIIET